MGSPADARTAAFEYDNRRTRKIETDYQNLWVKDSDDVAGWKQGTGVKGANGMYEITLQDMKGIALDDPQWKTFMDQLTWDELTALATSGSFSTEDVPSVDKPRTVDTDGPTHLKNGDLADGTDTVEMCLSDAHARTSATPVAITLYSRR